MIKRISVLELVVAGCAQQPPVNVSNPNANLDADRWACQQEVARMQQQLTPPPAAATPSSYTTNCNTYGSSTTCNTSADPRASSGYAQGFESTYRAGMLANAMPNCMRARGWR